MTKIFLILIAVIFIKCGPPSTSTVEGKNPKYDYNVHAILIEKYQDEKFHFVCENIENKQQFIFEFLPDGNGLEKYRNRKVGDTCFFEFISKSRYITE